MKTCPRCKHENADEANFCNACGASLADSPELTQKKPNETRKPVQPRVTATRHPDLSWDKTIHELDRNSTPKNPNPEKPGLEKSEKPKPEKKKTAPKIELTDVDIKRFRVPSSTFTSTTSVVMGLLALWLVFFIASTTLVMEFNLFRDAFVPVHLIVCFGIIPALMVGAVRTQLKEKKRFCDFLQISNMDQYYLLAKANNEYFPKRPANTIVVPSKIENIARNEGPAFSVLVNEEFDKSRKVILKNLAAFAQMDKINQKKAKEKIGNADTLSLMGYERLPGDLSLPSPRSLAALTDVGN